MGEKTSHPLILELQRLPKGERAVVTLTFGGERSDPFSSPPADASSREGPARPLWTLGEMSLVAGIQMQSTTSAPVGLQQLSIAGRQLIVIPSADVEGMRLTLRVHATSPLIGGEVELRGSAWVRFTTPYDSVSIVGFSSWYCRLF